jgi:capsule polysaccharide export protein KpsC/LpsZ
LAIVQGYDPSNAVAREVAIRRDLSVIAFENTAHKERMLWDDQSALTTNRNLAKNYFWRYRDSVAQEQAEAYCESLIAQTKANKAAEHESPARTFEGSVAGRPNVLFLGQVYTDSSIIFGLGAWETPVDLAVALARLAVELDFNLWFKLHPKEVSGSAPVTGRPYRKLTHRKLMANEEFCELSKDTSRFMVDHENTYDTYGLIAAAEVAVTVNSQAGLEAVIRGLPTVVAGDAFYGGLGFTQDVPEPRLLKVQLEHALGLDGEQKREATAEARLLAYIYFERYCIQKSPESMANLIARRCFARG